MVDKKQEEHSRTFHLAQEAVEDGKRWFPKVALSVPHHTLGLAGEVGEFANWVKKIDRGSEDIKEARVRYEVMMELTDVYIYVLNLAGILGLDLEKAYALKRGQNEARFGKDKM